MDINNKEKIQSILNQTYEDFDKEFSFINSWSKDIAPRLKDFSLRGKMVRSNLVLLIASISGQNLTEDIYKVATSVEILHASLLVHDDIMDNDTQRRGKESIFFQYQKLAQQKQAEDWQNIGKSLAICVGDLGFFLAYKLISSTNLSPDKLIRIYQELNKELIIVGLGQMQDIAYTYESEISENDILNLYKYKTGRYTFSLPFTLGSILANQPPSTISQLQNIGEQIGLIFQLKDDELGMFGTTEQIGKPIGSDIREGKKTLYYYYLMHESTEEERGKASQIFGNKQITEKEIDYIKNIVKKYDIQSKIEKHMQSLQYDITTKINLLPIKKTHQDKLNELVAANLIRKK